MQPILFFNHEILLIKLDVQCINIRSMNGVAGSKHVEW